MKFAKITNVRLSHHCSGSGLRTYVVRYEYKGREFGGVVYGKFFGYRLMDTCGVTPSGTVVNKESYYVLIANDGTVVRAAMCTHSCNHIHRHFDPQEILNTHFKLFMAVERLLK